MRGRSWVRRGVAPLLLVSILAGALFLHGRYAAVDLTLVYVIGGPSSAVEQLDIVWEREGERLVVVVAYFRDRPVPWSYRHEAQLRRGPYTVSAEWRSRDGTRRRVTREVEVVEGGELTLDLRN